MLKLMNDTVPLSTLPPTPSKTQSPPRVSESFIQFDTEELEFFIDEQLLKLARIEHCVHHHPKKSIKLSVKMNIYDDSFGSLLMKVLLLSSVMQSSSLFQ